VGGRVVSRDPLDDDLNRSDVVAGFAIIAFLAVVVVATFFFADRIVAAVERLV
jgi:hypothetical protein